jgi:sodium-dependent dicarboxylate transporter 2/3/5
MSVSAGTPTAVLSEREQAFDRARQAVGLVLGPLVFALLLVLPLGLEHNQQTLAAVFALTIVFWITEAIPIPVAGVVGVVLCVLLGVAEEDEVFGSFASGTIFLFIGGFVIAKAMSVHGLDRRFALRVLAIPGVGASTRRTIIAFGVISMAVSAFISNTAAVAIVFPIALGIVASIAALSGSDMAERAQKGQSRFATAVMLMVAYGASIGGLLTPIGAPHQLIGRDLAQEATGERVTFFEWSATFVPIVLVMFVVLCTILLRLNRPEVSRIEGVEGFVAEERRKLGSLSRGERNSLVAFGLAVTFWLLPGFIGVIAGDESSAYGWADEHLAEGVVAILAAATLFVLPLDWKERRFTLTWNEAARID